MTPEQEAAIRARHDAERKGPTLRTDHDGTPLCWADNSRWPCDAALLLAALDEARATSMGAFMDNEISLGFKAERDAARADADRLAGALGRWLAWYDMGVAPVKALDGHDGETAEKSRAALAAHEAVR